MTTLVLRMTRSCHPECPSLSSWGRPPVILSEAKDLFQFHRKMPLGLKLSAYKFSNTQTNGRWICKCYSIFIETFFTTSGMLVHSDVIVSTVSSAVSFPHCFLNNSGLKRNLQFLAILYISLGSLMPCAGFRCPSESWYSTHFHVHSIAGYLLSSGSSVGWLADSWDGVEGRQICLHISFWSGVLKFSMASQLWVAGMEM